MLALINPPNRRTRRRRLNQTASDSSSASDTGGGDAGKDTSVKDTGTSEAGSSDTGSTDTGVVDSGILPDASSNPPGNGVVIDEIDYDQAGLDEAEFVDAPDPTAVTQDLLDIGARILQRSRQHER